MKNLMMMTLAFSFLLPRAFAQSEEMTVKTVEIKNFNSPMKSMAQVSSSNGAGEVGQVIAVAREIVALGEEIYTLVQKGKPSNTTDFAPVAIVPRDPITKEIADPFEMERCSFPVEKKFLTTMNTAGIEVVRFEYMVIYIYGCSYNGKGKFIQAAMVQPVSVKTGYGWDFNASMKLSSIMNHGTKADPVVGAMLTIKYSMNSWRTAFERNDTIHITGKGELKNYSR